LIDPDTSIGGVEARFPQTHWSQIVQAAGANSAAREALIIAYWKPIYKYLRIQWKCSNDDAKDFTQGFLARALEQDFFTGYDPAKARFRTYLRASLDHFMTNAGKAGGRLKRSSGAPVLSLDYSAAENELSADPPDPAESIEEYFQAEWVRQVFAVAVEELQRDYAARGRETRFAIFARYDLDEDSHQLTYDQLAAEFAIPAANVTNWLAAARRDFRRCVLEQVRRMTADEREFRNEVRALLGIDA
jgi:RNA polymerase sigma factor (sigma-70 family)